jgi:hypothetical protein
MTNKEILGFLSNEQIAEKIKGIPNDQEQLKIITRNKSTGFAYLQDPITKDIKAEKVAPYFFKIIAENSTPFYISLLTKFYKDYQVYVFRNELHSTTSSNFEMGGISSGNSKEDSFIRKIERHKADQQRIKRFEKFLNSETYKANREILDLLRKVAMGISFHSIAKKHKKCHKHLKKQIVNIGFALVVDWYNTQK